MSSCSKEKRHAERGKRNAKILLVCQKPLHEPRLPVRSLIPMTHKQVLTIDSYNGIICFKMDNLSISISQLKTHPSKAISQAEDYPLVVKARNKIKAYLLGKELFEKIVSFIEDYIDKKAAREVDFRKGRDFEEVAKELNI